MKKLIISAIALLGISWANAVKAEADMVYMAIIGGQCQKLTVLGNDFTSICRDKLINMSWNNGRVLYMVSTDTEDTILLSFSGGKSQQPRLERYTLFLDTLRIADGEDISEQGIIGTCEMWGDLLKEKALHKCVAQNVDGGEIIFEFQSDPNQIEVIN
ncbi:hypothetical protein [Cyanobacterium aponinum]|uniref:hypothetical protein n=1 Tax=Cyanobacterium aponinum TaxID=379064 RepID=UPI000C12DD76|nr:hypothetical protein [Cyanobacterium aponinum]PHV63745.1 hypothetical protein CSQ80_04020 [Cyanobacterium aponinum IPPAS B-1201]